MNWRLTAHTLWRNGVEHLEQSAELCGRAVVDNENEEGKLNQKFRIMGCNEINGMKGEAFISKL